MKIEWRSFQETYDKYVLQDEKLIQSNILLISDLIYQGTEQTADYPNGRTRINCP